MDIGYAANEPIKVNRILDDFDFGIDEQIKSVITLSSPRAGRFKINWFADWIDNLNEFPVYYCVIMIMAFMIFFRILRAPL